MRKPIAGTLLLLTVSLVAIRDVQCQDIRKEFETHARVKWLDVRRNSFSDFSFEFKKEETEFDLAGTETRKIEVKSIWFSQGDFTFFETTPVSDSKTKVEIPFGSRFVKVINGKEAVMVRKAGDKEAEYRLTAREKLRQKFQFRPETLKPGWYQFQPRTVVNSLALSMADDPRLQLGRTLPMEYYLQAVAKSKPEIFDKFLVSTDPVLGRIVTSTFRLETKSAKGKSEVSGDFKFLADWNWLPISIQIETKSSKNNDKSVRLSIRKFSADYDRNSIANAKSNKRPPVPVRVSFQRLSAPKKSSLKIKHSFRALTMGEVTEINSFRSFKRFDKLER